MKNIGRRLQSTSSPNYCTTLYTAARLLIFVTVIIGTTTPSQAFRSSPLRLGRANTASFRPHQFRISDQLPQLSEIGDDITQVDNRLSYGLAPVPDVADLTVTNTEAEESDEDQIPSATSHRVGSRRTPMVAWATGSATRIHRRSMGSRNAADQSREYNSIEDSLQQSPYEVHRKHEVHPEVDSRVSDGIWDQAYLSMRFGKNFPSPSASIDDQYPHLTSRPIVAADGDSADMMEDERVENSSNMNHKMVTDRPTSMRRQLSSPTGAAGAAGAGRPVFNPTGW